MVSIKIIGFLVGLAIGSFINVLVLRKGGGLKGRSACPHCSHGLAWFDLAPILSFLWLRGSCRHCSGSISWQYPLVELAGGLGFLLILSLSITPQLTAWLLVIFSFSLLISIYDLKYLVIPDNFLGLFVLWLIVGSVLFWRGEIMFCLAWFYLLSFFCY